MNKLLSAELSRLLKSRIYRICLAFSVGLGVFLVTLLWYDTFKYADIYASFGASYKNIDSLLLASPIYILFVIGIFVGIFVGTEYSNGTIRNKIIVGHLRSNIYFSKLIICSLASVSIMAVNLVTIGILGKIVIGGTTFTTAEILALAAVIFFAILGLTAILLLIAMSVQSKSVASVSCVLFVIIMMFISLNIFTKLSAPEYVDVAENVITDYNTGEAEITYEKEKNPQYLTGVKRQVYCTLGEILPFYQIYQFGMNDISHCGRIIVYDCLIVLLTTEAGIIILRKKNLK